MMEEEREEEREWRERVSLGRTQQNKFCQVERSRDASRRSPAVCSDLYFKIYLILTGLLCPEGPERVRREAGN